MESADMITTLVVILQIITIVLILSTLKSVRELAKRKVSLSHNNSYKNRRDRDHKNNKRSSQDNTQRNHNQRSSGNSSTDPVEKSLRDINLKLKNAERDQEFARKKIKDNFSKDHSHRRDKNSNRRDRRGKWPDRNQPDHAVSSSNKNDFSRKTSPKSSPVKETVSLPEIVPQDFGKEELQHGRKVVVKRRMLKDEENKHENNVSQISDTNTDVNNISESFDEKSSLETSGEIKFGRR
ncbi:MAG TPA: hypothetical protein VKY57_14165 [Chitinispirillaceae bacterium]|nr:hypothetical protein [Chitinispirillaceae bacterium]